MWYAVRTRTGREKELADMIHKSLPLSLYQECFAIRRQMWKRLGGRWREQEESLFPAYIFIVTDSPEQLHYCLKELPEYAKIMGNYTGEFIPLERDEELLLRKICREQPSAEAPETSLYGPYHFTSRYIVPLSKISVAESGKVGVFSGPLKHMADQIISINLRKRYALVGLKLGTRQLTVQLGIKLEKDGA